MIATQTFQALFVAWQQPDTRRFFPVGRLSACLREDQTVYEFAYIQGASEAAKDGFQPFLAFPDFQQVYRSDTLFPFFTNRLMPRNRRDFPEYMRRLGIDETADDLSILARSSGVRATDSLEMFPLPIYDEATGCFETYFWMHGFRYRTTEEQDRALRLQPGERLRTEHEPTNPQDANAIRLLSQDGVFVGYIPRYLAGDACHLSKNCSFFEVFVAQVNSDPAPLQQRLLCRLESCWPDGFVPCDADTYKPVSISAWKVNPCKGEIEPD